MNDRRQIEDLLEKLYAARMRGDIETIGRLFAKDATFCMAGSATASPIAVSTLGHEEVLPLLKRMIDTFEHSDFEILSMLIDGHKVAVHWRSTVRHTGTNQVAETEIMDLIELADGRVKSFTEFCDTALAARLMAAK